jgi:hypothetical protein
LNPVYEHQVWYASEFARVVGNERGAVRKGDSCDKHIVTADGLAGLFKMDADSPVRFGGLRIKLNDLVTAQQRAQPAEVMLGTVALTRAV